MFKLTTMPRETAVELLLYLAENEKFPTVKKDLASGVTTEEVRALLREVAIAIAREIPSESVSDLKALAKEVGLSPKAKKILSALSERESKTLLSAFDLIDK